MLGALPREMVAEAKIGFESFVQLNPEWHKLLDASRPKAVLVPTLDTLKRLCTVAERKMAIFESLVMRQRAGCLWYMAPDELWAGWDDSVIVDGTRVPLFAYDLLLCVDEDYASEAGWIVLGWHGPNAQLRRTMLDPVPPRDPPKWPTMTHPPVPWRWLPLTPTMVLPMVLAQASQGLGPVERKLSRDFTERLELIVYWLKMASAEHVSQWRSFDRPLCLPPVRELPAPPQAHSRRRMYIHGADNDASASSPSVFSSSPPVNFRRRPVHDLYNGLPPMDPSPSSSEDEGHPHHWLRSPCANKRRRESSDGDEQQGGQDQMQRGSDGSNESRQQQQQHQQRQRDRQHVAKRARLTSASATPSMTSSSSGIPSSPVATSSASSAASPAHLVTAPLPIASSPQVPIAQVGRVTSTPRAASAETDDELDEDYQLPSERELDDEYRRLEVDYERLTTEGLALMARNPSTLVGLLQHGWGALGGDFAAKATSFERAVVLADEAALELGRG